MLKQWVLFKVFFSPAFLLPGTKADSQSSSSHVGPCGNLENENHMGQGDETKRTEEHETFEQLYSSATLPSSGLFIYEKTAFVSFKH